MNALAAQATPELGECARAILDWFRVHGIKEGEVLSLSAIGKRFGRGFTSAEINRALAVMMEEGLAVQADGRSEIKLTARGARFIAG